jgi:hypothetical protein
MSKRIDGLSRRADVLMVAATIAYPPLQMLDRFLVLFAKDHGNSE